MKILILHVGPGKCGSSSIQHFFKIHKNPCLQEMEFILLNPQTINELNSEDVIQDAEFSAFLDKNFSSNNILILSHEYLFQCPHAIKNICSLSNEKVTEILIVGYSRPQSGFLISTYSQWLFRSKKRVEEVKKVILNEGINPLVFTGLERQLIASIINDFHSARQLNNQLILDWNKSYHVIEKIISDFKVKIKPGVLPNENSTINLIEDFCEKANLTLRENLKNLTALKSNTKFNDCLIESIYNAVEFDLQVPGPHVDNQLVRRVSNMIKSNKKSRIHIQDFMKKNENFLALLKQYVDSYFLPSNIEFCAKYGIDKNYFHCSDQYSKNQMIRMIKKEEKKRISDNSMTNFYKELSGIMAETCIQLIKKSGETQK